MRNLMSLLLLLLFCSIQLTSSGPIALEALPTCCFEFSDSKIPLKRVVSYYRTSSSCPTQAIVFRTVIGREICVHPTTPWVKDHIAEVNKRTRTTTTAKTPSTTV
ncbi:monocyte chemotactic protein 1B [Ctenopharyngodon idella]|uniref:monocyte chemotactic protein 1B n=1 Tax=Ctenopharyngodon idella TaxID=7959 RepID=UPI00222E7691|nr:monocyte chemotactic protein 1B [Ctenopharyngodon idella]